MTTAYLTSFQPLTVQPLTDTSQVLVMKLTAASSAFANLPITERPPSLSAGPTAYTWVKLLHPPTAFSFDEAWLLCPGPEAAQWLAWIPDYGEILLTAEDMIA
jgi:hypothetical protein